MKNHSKVIKALKEAKDEIEKMTPEQLRTLIDSINIKGDVISSEFLKDMGIIKGKKMTTEQSEMKENTSMPKQSFFDHVKQNLDSSYGSAVIIGALYFKIYGEYPKIGLSGFQASAIDSLVPLLPFEGEIMEEK